MLKDIIAGIVISLAFVALSLFKDVTYHEYLVLREEEAEKKRTKTFDAEMAQVFNLQQQPNPILKS